MKRSILVVGDNPEVWEILAPEAEKLELQVLQAEDEEAAVVLCQAEMPCLVILDLSLSSARGLELMGRIRSLGGEVRFLALVDEHTGGEVTKRFCDLERDDLLMKERKPPVLDPWLLSVKVQLLAA